MTSWRILALSFAALGKGVRGSSSGKTICKANAIINANRIAPMFEITNA
jgi:hypothetical protein